MWALASVAMLGVLSVTLSQWTQLGIRNHKTKNVEATMEVKEAVLLHALYFEELCSPLIANVQLPRPNQNVQIPIPSGHLLKQHFLNTDSLALSMNEGSYRLRWTAQFGAQSEFRDYSLNVQSGVGGRQTCRGQKFLNASSIRCPEGQFLNRLAPDGSYYSCSPQAGTQLQSNPQCPAGQYFAGFGASGQTVCRSTQELIDQSPVTPSAVLLRGLQVTSCDATAVDAWALVLEQRISGDWVQEPTAIAFSYQSATERGCRLGFGDQQGSSYEQRRPFEVHRIEYGDDRNPTVLSFEASGPVCFRARCRLPLQKSSGSLEPVCPPGVFEDPTSWTLVSDEIHKVHGKVQSDYDSSGRSVRDIQNSVKLQLESNRASQVRLKVFKKSTIQSLCAGRNL
jgi:hypothetical protein